MSFLLAIAGRNLLRNTSRTVITGAAVLFGVGLSILGWGLVAGLDENVLRAARTTYAADLLLRPDGYPTDGLTYPLADAAPVPAEFAALLDDLGPWTARTAFAAKLVNGSDAQRITVWAYDGERDPLVFPRDGWKVQGRWPTPGANELAVGHSLARLLALEEGTDVVLQTRTRDGAINANNFRVVGLVRSDNAALDNLGAWLEFTDAVPLALLGDARSHLSVRLRGDHAEAASRLAGKGFQTSTLEQECEDLLALNRIRRKSLSIVVGMIMLIAAVGIANTVIMAAFERVREVGTLLALGMRRRDIRVLFMLEGGVMGLSAGLMGALLGGGAVAHLQRKGIDLSSAVDTLFFKVAASTVIYTQFSWGVVGVALAFGTTVSVLAALWPATWASRIVPADAVKAD